MDLPESNSFETPRKVNISSTESTLKETKNIVRIYVFSRYNFDFIKPRLSLHSLVVKKKMIRQGFAAKVTWPLQLSRPMAMTIEVSGKKYIDRH